MRGIRVILDIIECVDSKIQFPLQSELIEILLKKYRIPTLVIKVSPDLDVGTPTKSRCIQSPTSKGHVENVHSLIPKTIGEPPTSADSATASTQSVSVRILRLMSSQLGDILPGNSVGGKAKP